MLDRVEEIRGNIGYFENTYIFISGNLVQKKSSLIRLDIITVAMLCTTI